MTDVLTPNSVGAPTPARLRVTVPRVLRSEGTKFRFGFAAWRLRRVDA